MQLATVDVLLEDKLQSPKQHLESGEHIVTRVVELDKLQAELEGGFLYSTGTLVELLTTNTMLDYDKRVGTFPSNISMFADQTVFKGICCGCTSLSFRCGVRSCEGNSVRLYNRDIIAKVTNTRSEVDKVQKKMGPPEIKNFIIYRFARALPLVLALGAAFFFGRSSSESSEPAAFLPSARFISARKDMQVSW